MHEMSIAIEIIQSIMEVAPQFDHKKVKTVYLKVGKMSNIVVDSLKFCYDTIKSEYNLLAASELAVEEVPVIGKCRTCGKIFEVENLMFTCPQCSGIDVELEHGQELEISELEVEE